MAEEQPLEEIKEIIHLKSHVELTKECLVNIIDGRLTLLKILRDERLKLDKLATDVQICKVAGGVSGAVGAGLVIVGFVAAFFTYGTSLIISAIGAGLGGAGGLTASGASIADTIINEKKRKDINFLLKKDAILLDDFHFRFESLAVALQAVKMTKCITFTTTTIIRNSIGLVGVVHSAVKEGRTAFGVLRGVTKGFAIAGVVLSIISLPLDISMAVSNSIEIHKGSKHKLSKDFKQFEDDIEEELVSMEVMLKKFDHVEEQLSNVLE